MNVNIRISCFETSRYFVKFAFLIMGFSNGEGLSQLYLELVDAYKERFMSKNGQVVVLKCSSIWKKMRKTFKTLSELKAQVHSQKEACKREAMVVSAGKGNLLSLWKKSSNKDVSWVGAYIYFFSFKKEKQMIKGVSVSGVT